MDAMQESIAKLQQLFTERMDAYQGELQAASPSANVNTLKTEFAAFRSFILTSLQTLQQQVALLVRQVDNMEMRGRRKMLLCHGLPELREEDTAAVVTGTIVSRLKIADFSVKCISRCHRMGRAPSDNKPRPILLKLRDIGMRDKIWYAKTALKGSKITISEFLTKPRHDVFMAARDTFGVNKCFTQQGSVIVIGTDGKRMRISSMVDLKNIPVPMELRPVTTKVPSVTDSSKPAVSTKGRRACATSKK